MTHSPRQLSLEPRFRFLVHPIPIKYFQGFHSGNGKHEVVRGADLVLLFHFVKAIDLNFGDAVFISLGKTGR